MKISFFGAAKTVTGSCHMVDAAGKKFLIDCGLFQGRLTDQLLNYDEFPFNISEIDFVILTHAHIDHSGRIPKLYKSGFNGVIYATTATVNLCSIMLPDSGHIQEKEMEWVNKKRRRAGKKENEAIYTAQDATDCLELFNGIEYDEEVVINDNLRFILKDAGHMLGSSIVEIYVNEEGKEKKIVFTGDLGNLNMPIINDPTYIDSADTVVMESTYGDRLHGKVEDQSGKLIDLIFETTDRGGNLIIPSFAVGRTQEILYEINKYAKKQGYEDKLSKIPVYVDSPLAVNATHIFEEHPNYYDEDALSYLLKGDNPLDFENLHFVETSEESKALNEDMTPKVIISASGMCEVGRIKHHLKHNLFRPESTVLFVGFQAEGTLGRKLLDGEKMVKLFGDEIAVKAQISYLDAFSGHADKDGLIEWINRFSKKPENIFIVHGEYNAQMAFKEIITNKFHINCIIPDYEQTYTDEGRLLENNKLTYKSTRFDILEMLSFLKQDVDDMTNTVKSNLKNNINGINLEEIKKKLDEVKQALSNAKSI